jgi:hypothetical protein
MSERLTLVELTHWYAKNTQPLYPIGLILMPLGLLFSLLVFTRMCASADIWLEHFTWQSNDSCHNLLCSVFKEQLQGYYTMSDT